MKLIVGLGNPGNEYNNTRHNVGFKIIDDYLSSYSPKWQEKFKGLIYIKDSIIFLKPLTYMNNSGESVIQVVNYYKIDIQDILIIQDDLDMKFNSYKVKKNSESGGHNGIKSIIKYLNSREFGRLKIGINNESNIPVEKFVLSKFSKEELNILDNNEHIYNMIIDNFINYDIDYTINHQRRDV